MSRRRRPARSAARTRRPAAAQRRNVRAAGTPAADDPVAAYRHAAGYGRTIRVALLAALVLLDVPLIVRLTRHDASPIIGGAGIAAMAFFFAAVFIRHLVALHRLRSRQPELLAPSRPLLLGMLQAPFGFGELDRSRLDTAVLRATVVLGAALPPLIVVAGAVNRP